MFSVLCSCWVLDGLDLAATKAASLSAPMTMTATVQEAEQQKSQPKRILLLPM